MARDATAPTKSTPRDACDEAESAKSLPRV
jgi:hypothetical protein